MTRPTCNNAEMATGEHLPPIIGYRQVWSKDRKVLLQVFTDLETDLIELVTLDKRDETPGFWESLIKVKPEG